MSGGWVITRCVLENNSKIKMVFVWELGLVHRLQDCIPQYMKQSDGYMRLKRNRKELISKRALCLLYSRPGQYARRVRIYTTIQENVSMHHLARNKAHASLHHRPVLSSNSRASQSHHDRYCSVCA